MRVLVCGGRSFADWAWICDVLDARKASDPDLVIGCGYDPESEHFQGADELAYRWATRNGVPGNAYPAHWKREGRAAGPIRNQRMLDVFKPDLVLAFPGGRGTANMCAIAESAGVEVERP